MMLKTDLYNIKPILASIYFNAITYMRCKI